MAYTTFVSAPSNASDSDFRTWAAGFIAAVIAVGFTQTADTGQIDTVTVTAPVAVNTMQGYAIFAWSDPTGGNPLTMKVEFGSTGTAVRPGIRVTFGNGSDGSGGITGNTYTTPIMGIGGNTTTTYTCAMSGDGASYWTFSLWLTSGTNHTQSIVFAVGRTKDATGADVADGIDMVGEYFVNAGRIRYQTYLPQNGGGLSKTMANIHCAAPPEGTGVYGTTLGQFPVFCSRGAADFPTTAAIMGFTTDYGGAGNVGSIVTCDLYNVQHSYLFSGDPNSNLTLAGNGNKSAILIRFE